MLVRDPKKEDTQDGFANAPAAIKSLSIAAGQNLGEEGVKAVGALTKADLLTLLAKFLGA